MSIKAVARLAGVSTATISRTLRGDGQVAPETRERVLEAVRASGYQPNPAARSLRTRQSRTLLLLVPSISNPFFSPIIKAAERVASERGYSVLLGDTGEDRQKEADLARMLHSGQVDGIIQLSGRWPASLDDGRSAEPRMRCVNACELFEDSGVTSIAIDNRAAAGEMTDLLLGDGHRRIALLTGPSSSRLTVDRLHGAMRSFSAAGLSPTMIASGDYSMASGAAMAAEIVAGSLPPTAIFCFNDEMAIGVIHRLRTLGYAVPADISVAGFDDIEVARYCSPSLTTVAQPKQAIGEQAAALLIDQIEGRTIEIRHLILTHVLVRRQSTGPAPAPDRHGDRLPERSGRRDRPCDC